MYQRLGLAALVIGAVRAAVADPAVQEQVDEQGAQISAVRSGFDTLTERLGALESAVSENGTLDADQATDLSGIKAELAELATALAGPADDSIDNGVLAEVEQVAAEPSPAADAIVASDSSTTTGSGEQTGGEQTGGEQTGGEQTGGEQTGGTSAE